MAMASLPSFFPCCLFLLLFIHLACFAIFSNPIPNPKRRKITPLSSLSSASTLKPNKSLSRSILSYLNHLLCFRKPPDVGDHHYHHHIPLQSPPVLSPHFTTNEVPPPSQRLSFAARTDIFPCSTCGEVLSNPQLLDVHQATRHSLSELRDGDSGKNIVQIIFRSGWKGKPPAIHRILKIHNTPKALERFEEYREIVRSRAARTGGGGDERCLADGNERLRFYCSTILCELGRNRGEIMGSFVGVCGSQYCSTCGIVRHGFAGKHVELDGITTHATGWCAHVSLPEDLEREFAFLHVRRAMLVCRVVAGRVGRGGEEAEKGAVFDSVAPMPVDGGKEEELVVFNPRAVLPCFAIIYSA